MSLNNLAVDGKTSDPTFATRAELEALADAILRAAGTGLRHYGEYNRKRIIEAAEQEIARVLSAHAHLGQPK